MTLPDPFAYPTTPHVRRHGPLGYENYETYKPFLRDEFKFRCVYCLERELWHPNRDGSFSVDHFIPKAVDPARETDYENLVYACVRCNSHKQSTLTSLDPTRIAFSTQFQVHPDGRIQGLTVEAEDLIQLLHLNDELPLSCRQRMLEVLWWKRQLPDDSRMHCFYLGYFGFPIRNLPDLRRLRPRSNTKPEGIENSFYELHKAKRLPETY